MGSPTISVGIAIAWATFLSVTYVAVLWADKTYRIGQRSYTDPEVIRHRLVVASTTTAVQLTLTATLVTGTAMWSKDLAIADALRFALTELGLLVPFSTAAVAVLVGTGLTSLMYIAQLVEQWIDGELPGQSRAAEGHFFNPIQSPATLRNFVVGPLTEELVFRAAVLAPFSAAEAERKSTLFFSPIFFALAHTHHAFERYIACGRTRQAAVQGLQMVTVQVTYTFIFGWYANWLFLRSSSVIAPLAAHILCNYQGLPLPFGGPHGKKLLVLQLAGIAAFGMLLGPLTRPSLFGGHTLWT